MLITDYTDDGYIRALGKVSGQTEGFNVLLYIDNIFLSCRRLHYDYHYFFLRIFLTGTPSIFN